MIDDDLTFEEALAELEAIVEQLEMGDLPLERTLVLFERGQELAGYCEQVLSKAELRLEALRPTADGDYEAIPMDSE